MIYYETIIIVGLAKNVRRTHSALQLLPVVVAKVSRNEFYESNIIGVIHE